MSYFSIPDNTTNPKNPPVVKQNEATTKKTIGFAIAIIFGAGGLIVAGIGVGGYMGAISGLNQVNSIIMIATGGVGGIVLLIVGIVGSVKTHAQKAQEPPKQTEEVKKEEVKKEEVKKEEEKKKEAEKAKEKEKAEKAKEEELAKKIANAAEKAKEKESASKATASLATEKAKEKAKETGKTKETGKEKLPSGKEIPFSDNIAKLFDRTAAQVVRVKPFSQHCQLAANVAPIHDVILLGPAMVLFAYDLATGLIFSRAQNTGHVIVEDEGRPGVYRIQEVQTNGDPDNVWIVDTNKRFHIQTIETGSKPGLTPIHEITPVCMVESAIPKGYDGVPAGSFFKQQAHGTVTRTLKKGY